MHLTCELSSSLHCPRCLSTQNPSPYSHLHDLEASLLPWLLDMPSFATCMLFSTCWRFLVNGCFWSVHGNFSSQLGQRQKDESHRTIINTASLLAALWARWIQFFIGHLRTTNRSLKSIYPFWSFFVCHIIPLKLVYQLLSLARFVENC